VRFSSFLLDLNSLFTCVFSPEGNWGDDWSYRWNPQLWTGHGYGVIMIDFHGSTGYGQNFTNSIQGSLWRF